MTASLALAVAAQARKIGKHVRVPWREADSPEIIVHSNWSELKGSYKVTGKDAEFLKGRYHKAKREFDQEAAAEIVAWLASAAMVDRIVDAVMGANKPVKIVVPHPEFDPDEQADATRGITNALPFAFAAFLAAELGCEIDTDIIEVARPGRTSLNRFERFLWQPRFEGAVSSEHAYIIADDVCTLGGTFAALRSYIVAHGGTVIAVTALSLANGKCVPFAIAENTRNVLLSLYGTEFSTLWKEEIGHDEQSLTEGEGHFLVEWGEKELSGDPASNLQSLRDRLAKAASNSGEEDSGRNRKATRS